MIVFSCNFLVVQRYLLENYEIVISLVFFFYLRIVTKIDWRSYNWVRCSCPVFMHTIRVWPLPQDQCTASLVMECRRAVNTSHLGLSLQMWNGLTNSMIKNTKKIIIGNCWESRYAGSYSPFFSFVLKVRENLHFNLCFCYFMILPFRYVS